MQVARQVADAIVAHARAEAPNECCGVAGIRGDEVAWYEPAVNSAASALRFEMDGRDLFRLVDRVETEGLRLGIVHSHTRSAPYPSQTDVNFARNWPDAVWLIAGVKDAEAELRAFTIEDDAVTELAVELP